MLKMLLPLAIFLSSILPGMPRTASAQNAQPEVGVGGWVTTYPRTDIASNLPDLDLITWGDRVYAGTPRPEPITSAALEIRTPDNRQRLASIPFPLKDIRDLFSSGYSHSPGINGVWKNAPTLSRGQYLAAWIINGTRRSNVVPFSLDPRPDLAALPRVRLLQLEPEKPGVLPQLIVYVSRAVESDPAPNQLTICSGSVVLDGTHIARRLITFVGNNADLGVGATLCGTLPWEDTARTLDLAKPHTLAARIDNASLKPFKFDAPPTPADVAGFQESAPAPLETATPLAAAWDKATPALAAAPVIRTVLTGNVLVPVGNAAFTSSTVMDVTLAGAGQVYLERTHADYAFEFHNVPAGDYTLTCRPQGRAAPVQVLEHVRIAPSSPDAANLTVSFTSKASDTK